MEAVTGIVETPKGNGQKFDFDPALGCFKLKKVMPVGMVFPIYDREGKRFPKRLYSQFHQQLTDKLMA